MTTAGDPRRALERKASALVRSGIANDPFVARRGKAASPIPIHDPGGGVAGWFVGVTVGEQLAGYLRFDAAQELEQYSSFMRRPGSMDGCPAAASWLDPSAIQATARAVAPPSAALSEPILTYDQFPSRLAWAVDAKDAAGNITRIFVTGDFAYAATAG